MARLKGTGILMMNMGGPSKISDVHSFLSNLFHDGDLIPLPAQKWLAPLIARRRTPKIEQQYKEIGGGSPILKWTQIQGQAMTSLLDQLSPQTAPHTPFIAFRYVTPSTELALQQMNDAGLERAVAFSQYPQYSCTTTGSSLNELHKQLKSHSETMPIRQTSWTVLDRWPTEPGLVHAIALNIKKALSRWPEREWQSIPLLFSAHSLPMDIVNRGDPYPAEVAATVHAVIQHLPSITGTQHPYRLVWQSQVGPKAWLGQQTSDAIKGLRKTGHERAVMIPVAFTSDHIETLYEMDLEYVEEGKKIGLDIARADSLNDSPTFIRALADVTLAHLKRAYPEKYGLNTPQQPVSVQLGLRCPGCVNPKCGPQKQFWLNA